MDVQFINDSYADLFYEMSDVQAFNRPATIVHRGYHPKHGLCILVIHASVSHAVLIADGVTYL